MSTKRNFYIVYRAKDDSIAAVGSAAECAKQLGYTDTHSFYILIHRVRNGKCKTYEIAVSDDDECDE